MMRKLIDLHLHLDGSVPFSTIKKLIKENNLPEMADLSLRNKLSVSPNCHDLNEFLEKFAFPVSFMQTKENLQMIVFDLLKELKEQGLVYVEIRFAPQLHTQQGLSQAEVVRAAINGINQFLIYQKNSDSTHPDLHANLLLCLMRLENNEEENVETVKVCEEFLGRGVSGLDLAGEESERFAIKNYAGIFQFAQQMGIPYTIHAGEAMGPASVKQALNLGAKRIGHGIRSIENTSLINEIVQDNIILECCATSNLNTKVFDQIDHYPIKSLLSQGVKATLNSDDMTVCNTNLPNEYSMLEEKINLSKSDEQKLFLNAINAAFCSKEEKERLLSLI